MLSSFGAQHVDMASTAEDALAKCKFDFYDIILCDFNLGHGKNGQQILEALRAQKRIKNIHLFVMITAETAKDVVLGAREYQPDAYIAKPITRTVLEQRLGHLIKQQKFLKPINKEIDLENYSKAVTLCHRLLDDNTKYQSWCFQTLGKLYLNLGDTANAIKIYTDVLASREIPWALLGLGQALQKSQKYKQAIEKYKATIKQNPNMVEAYDGLSACQLELGRYKKAQETLQVAAELSPRIVQRQEKLGAVSEKNQDMQSAADAFRQAVRFAEHSVYEKPEHYLSLGKCLSEWSEGDVTSDGKERAKEAIDVLETLTNKFSNDEASCLRATLIETRVHQGQDDKDTALDKLHQAECVIEEENLSALVGLEFAKTLYTMTQPERAEKLLIDLAKKYEDQKDIIEKIEGLLDEPESLEVRKQAKEHNKSGIQLFEKGSLVEAISAFESALKLTPKHAALNLNIIQVLTKQFKESKKAECLDSAREFLAQISHIPEQHNQYKRMKHLSKIIDKLSAQN